MGLALDRAVGVGVRVDVLVITCEIGVGNPVPVGRMVTLGVALPGRTGVEVPSNAGVEVAPGERNGVAVGFSTRGSRTERVAMGIGASRAAPSAARRFGRSVA